MVCCAIGALIVATLAIWWKRLKAALSWRLSVPSVLATLAVAGVAVAVSLLAVEHLGHHAARADEQALLADINAQPICRGGPWNDGAMTFRITRSLAPKPRGS